MAVFYNSASDNGDDDRRIIKLLTYFAVTNIKLKK